MVLSQRALQCSGNPSLHEADDKMAFRRRRIVIPDSIFSKRICKCLPLSPCRGGRVDDMPVSEAFKQVVGLPSIRDQCRTRLDILQNRLRDALAGGVRKAGKPDSPNRLCRLVRPGVPEVPVFHCDRHKHLSVRPTPPFPPRVSRRCRFRRPPQSRKDVRGQGAPLPCAACAGKATGSGMCPARANAGGSGR